MKPKLEYFSHGPYVVELQSKLNALMPDALPPLKVDGKYGDSTVARVKHFQKSRGLLPDGLVGAKTWAAVDGLPSGPPGPSPHSAPSSPPVETHGSHAAHFKGLKAYGGAALRCDRGTHMNVFVLAPNTPATVADSKPWVNIMPFGRCKSPFHPDAHPEIWVDPIMGDVSFETGETHAETRPLCTLNIYSQWEGQFGPKADSPESEVIDKSARCLCQHGGRIRFV
jgi:hypothetical protein